MLLCIIIATHNRLNILKTLLKQIRKQQDSPFSVLVIVIDDGSTDGTEETLKQFFKNCIIIRGDGNWWWTRCVNEGFKKALELNSDFVLILNDDNEIQSDYLVNLAEEYNKLPYGSILGSMSVTIDPPGLVEMSGTGSFNRFWFKAEPYIYPFTPLQTDYTGIFPTYTLCGRGMLIPSETMKKIGLFQEKLVQYGSDDEYVLRARKNNIPTFISWKCRVYNHPYLTSESSSIKKTSFKKFTRNFFNRYSANSLRKELFLYYHYGRRPFILFYLLLFIAGSYKSHFMNFNHLKN